MPIDGLGVVSRAAGEPALVEDIVIDDPGPGEVLVRIQASGVCHTDLHYKLGNITDEFPFLLGHEGAGIIEAVGEGVSEPKVGDYVVLAWRAPVRVVPVLCHRPAAPVFGQPQRRAPDEDQAGQPDAEPRAGDRDVLHAHGGRRQAGGAHTRELPAAAGVAHRLRRDDRRGRGAVHGAGAPREHGRRLRLRRGRL